jgi:hypothetical protein
MADLDYDDRALPGDWQDCHECGGDGLSEDCSCGDDTCCCADPDFKACGTCKGEGGWFVLAAKDGA